MTPDQLIERLKEHRVLWGKLLGGIGREEASLAPEHGGWNLLQIVAHLADEERDDFRTRTSSTVRDPAAAWPSIDPEGWVTSRDYASLDWHETVDDFLAERDRSLNWLTNLAGCDWGRTHEHPKLGRLSAGDLLTSWVVHDLRHMAQFARTLAEVVEATSSPYSAAYAG